MFIFIWSAISYCRLICLFNREAHAWKGHLVLFWKQVVMEGHNCHMSLYGHEVDNVWQDSCGGGSKVQPWFLVRSTFTLQNDCGVGVSVNRIRVSVPLKILSCCTSESFSDYIPTRTFVKSRSFLACGRPLVLKMMQELAFYPAVALMYFFGVMKASQDDQVELDNRASANVFCLFVLAQPLCLVFGGYTGMAAYLLTALISYNSLPWRQTKQPEKDRRSKKKTNWERGT